MVDPTRCPDCSATLASNECPDCGLRLRGPLAVELWRVLNDIERLETRRVGLVDRLRAGDEPEPYAVPAPAPVWADRPRETRPVRAPRKEWTPQRVQNVILVTGVLVTLIAAVIFTAFQWGGLPLWARGGLMVAATVVTGWGAKFVHERGLASSAEAIGGLTVALGALDAYAVHAAGLAGDVDPVTYWTFATAVLAAGAAAFARVVPVRSVRHAALAGAQLPVVITVVNSPWSDAARAMLLGAQAAALVVASRSLGGTADAARFCGAITWVVSAGMAMSSAYDADPALGALALAVLAAVPLLWPFDRQVMAGLTTATLVLAAVAPARDGLTDLQLPAAVAAIGLLAVVVAASLPRGWREGPGAVGSGTVALALLAVAPHVASAVLAPFTWLSDVWAVGGDPAARAVVGAGVFWDGTVVTLGVVVVAAVTAAVVGVVLDERRVLRGAYVLAAVAVVLVPLGFAWGFRAALAWDVAAGVAALAVAVVTRRLGPAVTGCVVFAVAGGWSLANEGTTLAVAAAVAVAFAVVAVFVAREEAAAASAAFAAAFVVAMALSRGTPVDRAGFVLATTACTLLAAAFVLRVRSVALVAGATYVVALGLASTGVGWLAWTLALGTAVGAVRAVKDVRLVPVPAALGVACAGFSAVALGSPVDRAAFVVTVAAAAVVGLGTLLRDERVEGVAVAAYVVALALAMRDPGWLSWVLAAGGVTALAVSVRPERRNAAWVGSLLLTGCSWTRLYLEGVDVPEAYAAPLALTSLVFGHLRRRAVGTGSWQSYGPGLCLGLGPTTLLLLDDPGLTRPLLLGVVAMAVLFAGISERLQAPLAIGAGVLLFDALVQLAPVAAALPKWASIGAAGLVVIAVGVTYEDRRRDVDRLRRSYDALR